MASKPVKIYDTKAAKSAKSNNATQRAVGKIAKSTGMKPTSVLAAKSLGAKGKTSEYRAKVNSLAEGDKKVAKRIETTLNARNRASKKK